MEVRISIMIDRWMVCAKTSEFLETLSAGILKQL